MKMYCRGCNNIVKTKKIKDKTNLQIYTEYRCKNCGNRVLLLYENRRKDLR